MKSGIIIVLGLITGAALAVLRDPVFSSAIGLG